MNKNELVKSLAVRAGGFECLEDKWGFYDQDLDKFVGLLLEEVRTVLTEEYRKTPIECCGHLLRLDEAILEHFHGVDNDSIYGNFS